MTLPPPEQEQGERHAEDRERERGAEHAPEEQLAERDRLVAHAAHDSTAACAPGRLSRGFLTRFGSTLRLFRLRALPALNTPVR